MDIDTTGERLIFGSTTGLLWLSENGGDSWQPISTCRRSTARASRTNRRFGSAERSPGKTFGTAEPT
jgi:hypothetical protein